MAKICNQDTGTTYDTILIKSYEIIDSKKSGASAIMRAGIGAAILGPAGLFAGATAKKNYSVIITLNDGSSKVIKVSENDLNMLVSNVRNWI